VARSSTFPDVESRIHIATVPTVSRAAPEDRPSRGEEDNMTAINARLDLNDYPSGNEFDRVLRQRMDLPQRHRLLHGYPLRSAMPLVPSSYCRTMPLYETMLTLGILRNA